VRSFDERAEQASSERRGGGKGGPSPQQIRAVRKALKSRNHQIEDHLITLDTFLRLNGSGDPDQGPPEPETFAYEQVVQRFAKVAAEIRKVRDAVSAVDFDADDKQKFRAALGAAAQSWDARARMAGSMDSNVVSATLQSAQERDSQAATFGKSLRVYFEDD